jgi:transcriptional regulator with XRE-family HTH domain
MDKTVPTVTEIALLLAPNEHEGPWQHEAPVRHAIRRYLLIGCQWTRSWHRADAKAAALVSLARAERKVRLPKGWDSDGDLSAWIPSHECFCCGRFFVQRFESQRFCKYACARRFAEIERWNIARAGSTGPPRCKWCNSYMEVDQPNQAYCNSLCMGRAHSMAAADRADAELGAKIAATRFARGLTQRQLARLAGVDRTYITAIEGGDLPGSEDLRQQILNILELDPEEPAAATERLCLWCGAPTGSKRADVWYCCFNHKRRGERRAGLPERLCAECNEPIEPTVHLTVKTCSPDCARVRERRLERERVQRIKMNGSGHHHENADRPDPEGQPGPARDAPGDRYDQASAGDGREGTSGADAAPSVS